MSDNPASNPNFTDKDILTKEAYVDERNLLVRVETHEKYTVPQFDFYDWILSQHRSWRGDEWILDVGCGMGDYITQSLNRVPDGRYIASDLSAGMLKRARQHDNADDVEFLLQDAQTLAFPDNTFDVVLANHMLYHVPDISSAISELERVLRPDGVLITAVNSQFTMLEFVTLRRRALTLLGHPPPEEDHVISKAGYDLENGSTKLARHFRGVVRYEVPSALIFKEPEPVIDYINSTQALIERTLPDGVSWEDYMMVMENQIDRLIRHFGELVVNKLSGVLIATQQGGFAKQYFAAIDGNSAE